MGSEEIEKDKNSKSSLCKSIAQAAFSHIGLCVIVIIYCIIGGFLFELLEKENEVAACIESREEYLDMENETLFSLLDVVLTNPLNSPAADAQLVGVFETFRNNSLSIGYDGKWCEGYGHSDGPMHEWNFAGGLFFSMTVITTIGYGHIAPKTVWGRILCMSYAMLGIPFMLMFLANIGDALADVFRYVYARIICCGCMKSKKKHEEPPEDEEEDEIADDGVTVISKNRKPVRGLSSGLTRGTRAELVNKTNGTEIKQRSLNIKPLGSADLNARAQMVKSTSSIEPLIVDDDSDDEYEEQQWEELSHVAVPLTISLGIIGLYIVGGAILFKYWEEWDMLQSSYFCFITLSTIGFGDVTPGRDFSDPTANARLVIGTIYSVFGMAILSMCFSLMQEEMTSKFKWIGKKLGVVDKEEDDELLEVYDHQRGTGFENPNQSEC